MKAELDQGAIAVAHAVAEEEDRPVLTCVRISNGEIVATDGYIMVRHPVKIEGEGEILVPGKEVLRAYEMCPHDRLLLEQSGDDVRLKAGEKVLETRVLNAHFPTFESVYPTGEPAFIAFSPGLLRKLLDAVPDTAMIKFRIRKPTDPVEFIAGWASGLMMPMFTPEEDELWHKGEKAKLV